MRRQKTRFAACLCAASACFSGCDDTTPGDGGSVEVTASFTLPLGELSSLALRTVNGAQELCAVGDGSSFIVLTKVGADGELGSAQQIELSDLVGAGASSQWEGIAADGAGNLFVVQESGRVLVLDAALEQLLSVIELPASNSNAGAEGLLLLSNGHLLVVNERDPVIFVELGPPGAESEGIHAGLFEPPTFPLPGETATFVELSSWSVGFDDISDVAVFDGRLYVVSDESRAIGDIELPLAAGGGEAPLLSTWKLPAEIEKAEGLVILEGGTPIVGGDKKKGEPNAYLLAPLE